MSAKKRVAPNFDQLLSGSVVKMDREAVGGPDSVAESPESAEGATQTPEQPEAPATVSPPPAGSQSVTEDGAARTNIQRKKPGPVYEYERITPTTRIEETYIQTNVKLHPGVRTSYSQAVKVLKDSGERMSGRQFVHEALNAKFLTMAPFNEYTQRLHDEAETEHARKPEDRPGETAEQWRPPVRG